MGVGESVKKITKNPLLTENTIILEDFNLWYVDWDPTSNQDLPLRSQLADWMEKNNLHINNSPGEPTHTWSGVLDFVLSNTESVTTEISQHLHSTSDHKTLWTTVAGSTADPQKAGCLHLIAIDKNKFTTLLQHAHFPISEDLEEKAADLV